MELDTIAFSKNCASKAMAQADRERLRALFRLWIKILPVGP